MRRFVFGSFALCAAYSCSSGRMLPSLENQNEKVIARWSAMGQIMRRHLALGKTFALADGEFLSDKKPYLGVSIRALVDREGMVVMLVNSDSPASKAGLKNGDILLRVDGKPVNSIHDYYAAIGANASLEKTITVSREGEVLELKASLIMS